MGHKVETMAFVGDRGLPWHINETRERSQELEGLATSGEMLEAAGLAGWDVQKVPVFTGSDGADQLDQMVEGKWATARMGTDRRPLGIVGSGYQPIQNEDAFAFADELSGALYETAGSLRQGAVVWLSMELDPMDIALPNPRKRPAEAIRNYLLITNTHDGSRALEAIVTPVRVVCANTLNYALGSKGGNRFKVRHVGEDMQGKLEDARMALGIASNYLGLFKETAETLARAKMSDKAARDTFTTLWPFNEETVPEWLRSQMPAERAETIYQSAPDLDPIRGTAWGVVNAVVDYLDWGRPQRAQAVNPEERKLERVLFDDVAVKTKALRLVKDAAGVK